MDERSANSDKSGIGSTASARLSTASAPCGHCQHPPDRHTSPHPAFQIPSVLSQVTSRSQSELPCQWAALKALGCDRKFQVPLENTAGKLKPLVMGETAGAGLQTGCAALEGDTHTSAPKPLEAGAGPGCSSSCLVRNAYEAHHCKVLSVESLNGADCWGRSHGQGEGTQAWGATRSPAVLLSHHRVSSGKVPASP